MRCCGVFILAHACTVDSFTSFGLGTRYSIAYAFSHNAGNEKRVSVSNIMRTTLPTLSYNPTGFLWNEDFHSSAYTKGRAFPRTDLQHLVPWTTFETEIDGAITTRMTAMGIPSNTEYDIGSLPKKRSRVGNEEAVRQEARMQLHDLVVEVLDILGIEGDFSMPDSGNNQIVGEPDFTWLRAPTRHPKVVVRVSMISIFDRPHLCGTGRVQDKMGGPS